LNKGKRNKIYHGGEKERDFCFLCLLAIHVYEGEGRGEGKGKDTLLLFFGCGVRGRKNRYKRRGVVGCLNYSYCSIIGGRGKKKGEKCSRSREKGKVGKLEGRREDRFSIFSIRGGGRGKKKKRERSNPSFARELSTQKKKGGGEEKEAEKRNGIFK